MTLKSNTLLAYLGGFLYSSYSTFDAIKSSKTISTSGKNIKKDM